jgi:hypothetical protein
MWLRLTMVPVGAFVGYNLSWITIGVLTPGDLWANGYDMRLPLAASAAALAVLAFYVRPLVLRALLIAAALGCGYFRLTTSNGWWAKAPPGRLYLRKSQGPELPWREATRPILDLVGTEWRVRNPPAGWQARVSPPLPMKWPPNAAVPLVAYAYATRRLSNGEETTPPWAEVFIERGQPMVNLYHTDLAPIGVQDIRSLRAGEAETAALEGAAVAELEAATRTQELPEAPLVRRYYCFWQATNRVIASSLKVPHAKFFAWLACPP